MNKLMFLFAFVILFHLVLVRRTGRGAQTTKENVTILIFYVTGNNQTFIGILPALLFAIKQFIYQGVREEQFL